MVKLTPTGVKINSNLVWTSHNTGGVEFNTGVFAVQNLSELGKLLLKARIIWSSILPRLFYYGAHRKGAGKDFQRKLDNVGRQYCIRELGGCAISHKDLYHPYAHHLFIKDAIHLSDSGNWVYRQNIENALCFFQ